MVADGQKFHCREAHRSWPAAAEVSRNGLVAEGKAVALEAGWSERPLNSAPVHRAVHKLLVVLLALRLELSVRLVRETLEGTGARSTEVVAEVAITAAAVAPKLQATAWVAEAVRAISAATG
jgi:hypothetical protein